MGRMAAEHLIDRGFPRLYGFFEQSHKHAMRLGQACEQYAKENGVPCTLTDIQEGAYLVPEEWYRLERTISRCLNMIELPAGVVVENSEFARLFIQFAMARGLQVPRDVAVLCQDNFQSIVSAPPQISSIHTHFEAVGYEAARLLTELIEGKPVPDEPVYIPSRGVVGRESTDFFAVKDELIAQTLQFISTRLHQKLRVDEIAFELNVSPRLLQKRFSDALGRGVGEEIRRLRLEKAKRMLAEPERLIGSIPKAVGFATADVMNKIFKREMGMTPSEFRKKLLHSDGFGEA